MFLWIFKSDKLVEENSCDVIQSAKNMWMFGNSCVFNTLSNSNSCHFFSNLNLGWVILRASVLGKNALSSSTA